MQLGEVQYIHNNGAVNNHSMYNGDDAIPSANFFCTMRADFARHYDVLQQ